LHDDASTIIIFINDSRAFYFE